MKSTLFAAALLAAAAPLIASQQPAVEPSSLRQITFHGCVTPGIDKGTYVLAASYVLEPEAGRVPEFAHGRQVFFWLDDDADIRENIGRTVEVRGEFASIEESEVEIKAGRHKDGGLIVEFEGPGKDLRTSAATSGVAVGTAGARTPEKNDIKSYLLRVDVKSVTSMGTCG